MLILSRRPGDAILIDGGIRIVVLAADSRSVRIGIEAPSSVGILREEVVRRMAEENRRSGSDGEGPWLETPGTNAADTSSPRPPPTPPEDPPGRE